MKPSEKSYALRLKYHLWELLTEIGKAEDRSNNYLINQAVEHWVEDYISKHPKVHQKMVEKGLIVYNDNIQWQFNLPDKDSDNKPE